jgi:hypothetical protein
MPTVRKASDKNRSWKNRVRRLARNEVFHDVLIRCKRGVIATVAAHSRAHPENNCLLLHPSWAVRPLKPHSTSHTTDESLPQL